MYDKVLKLIENKLFKFEYSINTIKYHGLYAISESQKRLLSLYEFYPNDWLYHREDSKINDDKQLIYMKIEFINPITKEELSFIWEESNNEN